MTKLRALIVGGTSGIGHGIALALAGRGNVEITIAGRSKERGESIVQELSGVSSEHQHKFVAVDGFDLNSVKKLVEPNNSPDILVMTQGMATLQGYTPTKDGIDQKLQLHYFSRFYLFRLLAPHMKPNSRILTVLSGGVHGSYNNYSSDFELREGYSAVNAADAAGYYTDAGFEALSKEYPELVVSHAAPGFVNTRWGSEFPTLLRTMIVRPMMRIIGRDFKECGNTLVSALMGLPRGYSVVDPKGKVIENGLKHKTEDQSIILEKTLALLPDL